MADAIKQIRQQELQEMQQRIQLFYQTAEQDIQKKQQELSVNKFFLLKKINLHIRTMHANFGIKVLRQLMSEENFAPKQEYWDEMFEECHAAEKAYANYILREPILGYNAEIHLQQYEYIVNRRAKQIGLTKVPYPNAVNAVPWLDEQTNLRKEKNFFETRVVEYKSNSSLDWGDD